MSGLFVAVSPALLAALGHHQPIYTGGVVSVMFAAGAVGTIASSRMRTHSALAAGTALLLAALGVLAIALAERSAAWLTAAAATAGMSEGIGLRAALTSVNAATPESQRGLVTSAFFAIAYVGGISIPVLGVGLASRPFGLIPTGEAFAAIVAAPALAALVRIARAPRLQNADEAGAVVGRRIRAAAAGEGTRADRRASRALSRGEDVA